MDKQLLISYGIPALGGLPALLFFFLSIRAGRRQRLVSDLPTSKTTGVFIGLVELFKPRRRENMPRTAGKPPLRLDCSAASTRIDLRGFEEIPRGARKIPPKASVQGCPSRDYFRWLAVNSGRSALRPCGIQFDKISAYLARVANRLCETSEN
jgi:hypothetical protein